MKKESIKIDTSHIIDRSTSIASLPAKDSSEISENNYVSTSTTRTSGKYVGSRGGTSYYLPTCAGAKRISDKNKIFFNSKEEAEQFGYKPAKTCKGI